MQETPQRGWAWLWHQWIKPLVVVVFLLGTFRSAVADWNDVPSGSMKPTILVGDRIFVNKLAYDLKVPFLGWRLMEWGAPERGDIVVFASPVDGTRMVKRVVAVPGDRVALEDGRLWINGRPASYRPLSPAVVGQLSSTEQAAHRFAAEEIGGRQHAMMKDLQGGSPPYFGPVVLGEGEYFVLGDNRDHSFDSRWFGPVSREAIAGEATAVALSLDPDNSYFPRWQRFFHGLN